MKKVFLIAMSLFSGLVASAYDFEDNGFYYNILSLGDLTAEVTCMGDGTAPTYFGDITIPATAEYAGRTFAVTTINSNAFKNCSIGTLTIPATVLYVGGIYGNITNLIIEDSDTPLECSGDALIGGKVTGSVYLGRYLGDPENYEFDDPFHRIGGTFSSITFGDKITKLGGYFQYCENLTSIVLPETIKSLYGTFVGCSSLKSVTAPGVTYTYEAFEGCTSLETIDMPNIRHIDDYTFKDCGLKNYTLPQGVLYLGSHSFHNCKYLESIVFPATLISFTSGNTFSGCDALTDITVSAPTPRGGGDDAFDIATYMNATLKVPVGTLEAYKNDNGWKNFFNIVEDASITDDIYAVSFSARNGNVSVECDEVLPEYESHKFVKKGSTIKVVATPNDGYVLSALRINGVDVIADVVDNTYITTAEGYMSIYSIFEQDNTPTPIPDIYLSIKQADNGNVKLKVNKWNYYQLLVEPAEGWRIHSVTFNRTDVTGELSADNSYTTPGIVDNSELVVAYVSAGDAIDETRSNQSMAKVTGSSGKIMVSNAEAGETISVYTTGGILVNTSVAGSGATTINVQENEVYIVKVGSKTVKIGM